MVETKSNLSAINCFHRFRYFRLSDRSYLRPRSSRALLDRLIVMRSGNSDAGKRVGGVVILFDLSIFQSEAGQTIFMTYAANASTCWNHSSYRFLQAIPCIPQGLRRQKVRPDAGIAKCMP